MLASRGAGNSPEESPRLPSKVSSTMSLSQVKSSSSSSSSGSSSSPPSLKSRSLGQQQTEGLNPRQPFPGPIPPDRGQAPQPPSPQVLIQDLRERVCARDRHIRLLETSAAASEDVLAEWQAKYDRLWEAHRKLQKTNHSLEDKLLRVVDKFEADRNQLARDLASQTQKLVQAKLATQQLREGNADLQADLHLAISLLQNRPSAYLAQRVGSLPQDVRSRVKDHLAWKNAAERGGGSGDSSAKRIRVPIMEEVPAESVGDDERVSAAILAKVLEERAKERRREKFCIDVGTQTHSWQFPEKIYSSQLQQQQQATSDEAGAGKSVSNNKNGAGGLSGVNSNNSATARRPLSGTKRSDTVEVIQILRSISMEENNSGAAAPNSSSLTDKDKLVPAAGSILFASVIRSPPVPTEAKDVSVKNTDTKDTEKESKDKDQDSHGIARRTMMPKSATFSSIQTDI